jgi:hypothetical protein
MSRVIQSRSPSALERADQPVDHPSYFGGVAD